MRTRKMSFILTISLTISKCFLFLLFHKFFLLFFFLFFSMVLWGCLSCRLVLEILENKNLFIYQFSSLFMKNTPQGIFFKKLKKKTAKLKSLCSVILSEKINFFPFPSLLKESLFNKSGGDLILNNQISSSSKQGKKIKIFSWHLKLYTYDGWENKNLNWRLKETKFNTHLEENDKSYLYINIIQYIYLTPLSVGCRTRLIF